MDSPVSFFLFFFLVVPFALMNITAYRKERRKADQDLQSLLTEDNNLLREQLEKKKDTWKQKGFPMNQTSLTA